MLGKAILPQATLHIRRFTFQAHYETTREIYSIIFNGMVRPIHNKKNPTIRNAECQADLEKCLPTKSR